MANFTATTDADTFIGAGDQDNFIIAPGTVGAGDYFDGGWTYDRLLLQSTGAGTHVFDLTLGFFKDIEIIRFEGDTAGATLQASLTSAQWYDGGGDSDPLELVGGLSTIDQFTLIIDGQTTFFATNWDFTNWGAEDSITFVGSIADDHIRGSDQADTILGGAGDDILEGGAGSDRLVGGADNDRLVGGLDSAPGAEADTAVYTDASSHYYVYLDGADVKVRDERPWWENSTGTDTLQGVEFVEFSDRTIDLSTVTANAGPTANAGGPYYVQIGSDLQLSGLGSTDPNTAAGDRLTYRWDLDNDGSHDDATSATPLLTAAMLNSMFPSPGTYTISLYVNDMTGAADVVTTTITIAASATPEISSDGGDATAALSLAENLTAVTTVAASDANTNDTVTYSISGGADAGLFSINAATGELVFNSAPDFEAPADAGADNVYDVVVRASDGTLFDEQAISVTVTDTHDVVNGTAGDDVMVANAAGGTYNGLGGNDTITGSGVDDTLNGGAGDDGLDGGAGNDTAEFSGARANYFIYTDGANLIVRDLTGADGVDTLVNVETLSFTDGAIAASGFTDNEAPTASAGGAYLIQLGADLTLVATANDGDLAEGDVISYAWDFNGDTVVDATTLSPTLLAADLAVLGLGVGSHTLSLTVTDSTGASATSTASLTIEAPVAPVISSDGGGANAAITIAENTSAVTTVVATDTNTGDTVQYSLDGADAALFTIDANGVLTFAAAPDYDAPADVGADNVYDVIVRASDGVLYSEQAIAVTVTDTFDDVYGTSGNDTLVAHAASGRYFGLDGDDTYEVSSATDEVVEAANEGTDRVNSSINYTLGANVETLALMGAATSGTGNADGNTLLGNALSNTLMGLGGSDTIHGGDGGDLVYGGAAYNDPGDAADSIYGEDGDDTLFGNGGDDFLAGGAGKDIINGGQGADLIYGGNAASDPTDDADLINGNRGNDTIYGNAGNDIIYGGGDTDTVHAGEGDDTIYGGEAWTDKLDAADWLYGDEGNDFIYGNSGDDTLEGGLGNDYIHGGQNVDTLYGGDGADTLNGGAHADVLTGGADFDTFAFLRGQANGDVVTDFAGNGAAAGDMLQFIGYSASATFTQIDATHWKIVDGALTEIITFSNEPTIDPSDWFFG